MRILDLLTETQIKISDFAFKNKIYWKNILNLIKQDADIQIKSGDLVKIENPEEVYNELYSIWDGVDFADNDQISALKSYKLPIVGMKKPIPLQSITKTAEIKSGDSGDGELGSSAKFWNIGNVVECVMGAAVTAKFINPTNQIGWKDIVAILKQMTPGAPVMNSKGKTSKLVPYTINTMASNDKLTFTMSLNTGDFDALKMSYQDANTLQTYDKHQEIFKAYTDAAEYVNTADTIKTAIDRVQSDPNKNTIIIESEGASHEKQTSTKADLFITIDNKRERLLSLKAKQVPQVGQVSGHAFENLEEFFKSTLGFGLPKNFAQSFPKGSFNDVGAEIFKNAFPKAYQHMFSELSKTLAGQSDYKEYDFVKQIYHSIQHHATLGEDVIIVYLSPSATRSYTELKIGPELLEALKEFKLVPTLVGTTLKVWGHPISELGKKITDGKPQEFVQLRSYLQKGSTVRNIIEIKTLLKSLADVEMIKQRQITKNTDELDAVKKNAGIKSANKTIKPPIDNTKTATPGIANQNIALNKSKIPMGQEQEPIDDVRFSGE
jgi:hypothetical protein